MTVLKPWGDLPDGHATPVEVPLQTKGISVASKRGKAELARSGPPANLVDFLDRHLTAATSTDETLRRYTRLTLAVVGALAAGLGFIVAASVIAGNTVVGGPFRALLAPALGVAPVLSTLVIALSRTKRRRLRRSRDASRRRARRTDRKNRFLPYSPISGFQAGCWRCRSGASPASAADRHWGHMG